MTRTERIITVASLIAIAVAALILVRMVPVDDLTGRLRGWVEGRGAWGPVVFGLIYVLATVAMLPGWPLTLVGGAVFGVFRGTLITSLSATVGGAAAFLISRHLVRQQVTEIARKRPAFGAVDRAIGERGWRIVALMRLSPAIPFNLQNYFYGITAIRFWPCVLASWIFMLPGSLLYVYLGDVGARGAQLDERGEAGRWVIRLVGLAATIAVTVYLAAVARRAIREQLPMETTTMHDTDRSQRPGRPWRMWVLAGSAVLLLAAAAYAHFNRAAVEQILVNWFGPPSAELQETHPAKPGGPKVDHAAFDTLLRQHVDEAGWVDYAGLAKSAPALDAYIASFKTVPVDELGRDERLTLLINAYNAFTLRLILDHYQDGALKSIRDIDKPWDQVRWTVGSNTLSLNQIEHEQIRPNFKEPRIHFALVCAAVGCPILRSEAYHSDRLDEQLAEQTRYVHEHDRWFKYDPASNTVWLTKLYQWYGGDFEQVSGTVLDYAATQVPALATAMESGKRPTVKWLEYDWALNDLANAK